MTAPILLPLCRLCKDTSRWGVVEGEGDTAFFALWPPWAPHRPDLPDALTRLPVPKAADEGEGREEPVLLRTATAVRGLGPCLGIRGLL